MKILLLTITVALLVIIFLEVIRIFPLYKISKGLVDNAVPYQRAVGTGTVLVIGDSTGVGVGVSTPEDSIAGLIALLYADRRVENHSVSGAQIQDIEGQLAKAGEEHFALILLQIGANDIIRFRSSTKAGKEIAPLLQKLVQRADRVIFISAGNVGGAYLFPWFLRPYYHHLTLQYHAEFARVSSKAGVVYVNLYTPPKQDLFILEPTVYFAGDRLHPSSAGYALWFGKIASIL